MRPRVHPGDVFHFLTVVEKIKRRRGDIRTKWRCKCACGKETLATATLLRKGTKKSCGCMRVELLKSKDPELSRQRARTYKSYDKMMTRCNNPRSDRYKDYGARGIKVCQRWAESFDAFVEDMGLRPDGKTIGRLDNDGNYELGNCAWQTAQEQAINKRNTLFVETSGGSERLVEVCARLHIEAALVRSRLNLGWTKEEAFGLVARKRPPLTRVPKKEYLVPMDMTAEELRNWRLGLALSQSQAAQALDVALDTYRNWEQGRRKVSRPVVMLTHYISEFGPATVVEGRVTGFERGR